MRIRWLVGGLIVLVLSVQPAWAQWPVTDSAALTQRQAIWVQEAFQWARSIAEEVKMNAQMVQSYEAMLRSYAQDAKAFVGLPMEAIGEIQALSQTYLDLLNQGAALGQSLSGIGTQFDALFGADAHRGDPLAYATKVAASIRDTARIGAQVSSLYAQLCLQLGNKTRQLQLSRASIGALSAQQATAELLGTVIDQNLTMQEMQAATARMQLTFIMQQTTAKEQVREVITETWMRDWPAADSISTEGAKLPGVPAVLQ